MNRNRAVRVSTGVCIVFAVLMSFAMAQSEKPVAESGTASSTTGSEKGSKRSTDARPARKRSAARSKTAAGDPQHELALRLLGEAEAESGVLDAAGRAGLLYITGHTYATVDKQKARELFESAYQNALVAYDQRPDAVGFMLDDLVAATTAVAPNTVEQSLPPYDSARDYALRLLIKRHVAEKDVNRAIELLLMMKSDQAMTYAAVDLLMALPPTRQDDRDRVFATVLEAYKNSKHMQVGTGSPKDLGTLVVRFHSDVNQALVQQAINVLLDEAKSMSQHVVMSTAQRTVTFSSYQFRLFQLLPALRHIDPDRAESLLKDEKTTASLLQQYPDGQRTVDDWLRDTPMKDGETRQTRYAYVRDGSLKTQATNMEIDRTVDRLARQAETDPNSAISNAARISDVLVRTRLLLTLAQNCQKKNPAAAKAALRQVLAAPPDDPSMYRDLKDVAEMAREMGDFDLANAAIAQGLKLARALYDFESDKDDPNQALKVNWVSVRAYRELLAIQVKLAPDAALQSIKEIPDAEVGGIEKVVVAATLLNAPLPETSPVAKAEKGKA